MLRQKSSDSQRRDNDSTMFKDKTDVHVLEKGFDDGYSSNMAITAQLYKLKKSNRRSGFISTLFICISIVQAIWILRHVRGNQPASSRSHPTEFKAAREAMEKEDLVQRNFSGWWVFDEKAQFVRRHVDLSKPQFFGNPNEISGISKNWEKLMEAEFPSLSEQEASTWPHLTNVPPFHNKFMELDVTHSLHCVNHLRKLLSAAYYNDTESSKHLNMPGTPDYFFYDHMNHCLEQLFETVTCQSDLTPIPLISFFQEERKATFAIGGQHTCRNFNAVRGWLYDRTKSQISINNHGATYKGNGEYSPL